MTHALPEVIARGLNLDLTKEIEDRREYRGFVEALKSLRQAGVNYSGAYWLDTGQRSIAVCFDQTRPFAEQLAILSVLPLIRPAEMEHGPLSCESVRRISVFESTLSEAASYMIAVRDGGSAVLLGMRHGMERAEAEFPDVREALRYVYDRHPYIRRSE